ncbi:DUF1987 domain-containing protein [Eisenibacter elegans]|uniref:DUF1987 domain-containing protein n=1 Tax=Eisenibacter elegans TaxID=997 RepID=UPI000410B70A|nr:DUF1987 domain-containing protein [Eisenibacter elegans]
MDNISIKKTIETPEVLFDFNQGLFEIKGVSIPEDADDFYRPLLQALEMYIAQSENADTRFRLEFNYFNTNTSAILMNMLKMLEEFYLNGHSVMVEWRAEEEDEDMYELGEYFSSLTKLPFELVVTNLPDNLNEDEFYPDDDEEEEDVRFVSTVDTDSEIDLEEDEDVFDDDDDPDTLNDSPLPNA